MIFVYCVLCVLIASMMAALVSMVLIAVTLNVVAWVGNLIDSIDPPSYVVNTLFVALILTYMVIFGSLLEYHQIVEFPK